MKLKDIFKNIEIIEYKGDLEKEIKNISSNSKEIQENDLFFAIKGYTLDGTQFIPNAIENGATAIAVDETCDLNSFDIPNEITFIKINRIRYHLAIASANLYGHPSTKLKLIGVTGTKGKTTSTYMIKSILEKHNFKVGLIGSIAIYIGDEKLEDTDRTTAESYKIQKTLAQMVDENVEIAILEVSSQAMKLDRVVGCHFDEVLFTNLTEDHISPREHKDMEDYFNAKLSLVKMAPFLVTNLDNDYTSRIPNLLPEKEILTFGMEHSSDIMAKDLELSNIGVHFTLVMDQKEYPVYVSIPGKYMVYNCLGAIGIAKKMGCSISDIQEGLKNIKVFGRSEVVPNKLGLKILIDYAHTPSSLQSILETVKPYTKGRVICTWGVGGDRDRKKRPIMGEISGNLADLTILTSDQVRTEEPEQILNEIEVGLKRSGGNYVKILNRTEAIRYALSIATTDDIIVLPGLGSDLYIEYMHVKYPYNERTVIHDTIEDMIASGKRNPIGNNF